MIRLYVCLQVYPRRHHLFPLLKPFEKGVGYLDAARIASYGISENDISFVDTLEACDYAVLPMSWNFYLAENKLEEVKKVIQKAKRHTKKVLSFMTGDFGVTIPYFESVIVFRHSGDNKKLPKTHIGFPAFVEDPLPKIFNTQEITIRGYQQKPTVGFCGQANRSLINAGTEILKTIGRNSASAFGLSIASPQQVLSTSYLRASVLKSLSEDTRINANFILRKQYRAGATTAKTRKKTTLEFYENMRNSDYVVCVRGAGNFSVRFYETLAMGRIPVFIDTDCLLPLNGILDWKEHVVWVPYHERHEVSEKVANFHKQLSSKQFEDLQQQNRTLWKEKLTLGGFFKSYLGE